jgi:hypothetical protein
MVIRALEFLELRPFCKETLHYFFCRYSVTVRAAFTRIKCKVLPSETLNYNHVLDTKDRVSFKLRSLRTLSRINHFRIAKNHYFSVNNHTVYIYSSHNRSIQARDFWILRISKSLVRQARERFTTSGTSLNQRSNFISVLQPYYSLTLLDNKWSLNPN